MMSERSGPSTLGAMSLEEPGGEQASPRAQGPLRCGPCAVWPRQQTWLCAVPLMMGFVGLGLSLMLLKWIVVGSVQDYVPTDLVDAKGIGQDPIFLSEPSAMPKRPDTMTITIAATTVVSTSTPLAADATAPAPRTRYGPPSNHSAPHLHNRVSSGTRVTGTITTTRATRLAPPGGKEVTPRSTTVRRVSGTGNGRKDKEPPNSRPSPTSTTTKATSMTSTTKTTMESLVPTSPPSHPAKTTGRWNPGRSVKGPVTRPHHRFRTMPPTSPSLRSEVFKPCIDDKDLAFCLNEGECSIIETVAGVHRHCRCKEGYHGLRCDQFVPKTDSILSDSTDELGIEFMESRERYQRQVLSIFSIASGICFLGVACIALYRHNKRHREKLRAHFTESRNLREGSINASGLMSKSSPRPQCGRQLQKSCKSHRYSPPQGGGSVTADEPKVAPPTVTRALSKGKCIRSSSLSHSPAQRHPETHHFRTPPISRGLRVSGPVYKHLQEVESTEIKADSLRRTMTSYSMAGLFNSDPGMSKHWISFCTANRGLIHTRLDNRRQHADDQQHSGFPNMQTLSRNRAKKEWREVPCTRLDRGLTPFPSLRARSVPIIPSLQGNDSAEGCVEQSKQGVLQEGSFPKPGHSFISSSEIVLESEARPSHVCPHSIVSAPGSEKSHCHIGQGSCETSVGSGRMLQQSSLVASLTAAFGSGVVRLNSTNTAIAVTMLESEGKSMQYIDRLLYSCPGSRGPQAGVHTHAQELGKQHSPLIDGVANCFLSRVAVRSAGTACVKTADS